MLFAFRVHGVQKSTKKGGEGQRRDTIGFLFVFEYNCLLHLQSQSLHVFSKQFLWEAEQMRQVDGNPKPQLARGTAQIVLRCEQFMKMSDYAFLHLKIVLRTWFIF